ncbi:MAG: DinB family protein [Candidatus Rokuibacteriota bacterium]
MPIPTMDDVAKQPLEQRLARMARTPDDLAAALEGQPETAVGRRPDAKSWCAKEVVCHLRDTEESFMTRFQAIAAMSEPRFTGVDPDRWAAERQYQRNDTAEALEAFRRRRQESLDYLRGVGPDGWQRGGIHPTRGRMTVNDVVTLMAWHDDNHLDQLRRALPGKP